MENYFNYFTEIEECFRKCRGTPTLLSTLDWALIEAWKESGIPLEAVVIGIERAFQKFGKRPQRFRKINGLAFCSQSVLGAAEELAAALREGGSRTEPEPPPSAAFTAEEVRAYLDRNATTLEEASAYWSEHFVSTVADGLHKIAISLFGITPDPEKLQDLEQVLSAFEDKLTASVTLASPVELLAQFRQEVDRGLAPYRRNMTALQIESLQRQFLKKRLFEHYRIPRLSLFYL
ncbi:MAG TPA: hypothetical protein VGW33_02170 [Terriglobia bacterium]|nr:hypothetical protein [Terriglobia bacterium]